MGDPLAPTVIIGIPARVCRTAGGRDYLSLTINYRRILVHIGRAMKQGAAVEATLRVVNPKRPKGARGFYGDRTRRTHPHAYDVLDVTIDWNPS